MFIGSQVRDGLAEVPQELVARRSALHHVPGKYWHPGQWIVPAQFLELDDHIVGPVLRTRFPAIVDHIADAAFSHHARAYRLLVAVQVPVSYTHLRAHETVLD